jgi:hypothetical protein
LETLRPDGCDTVWLLERYSWLDGEEMDQILMTTRELHDREAHFFDDFDSFEAACANIMKAAVRKNRRRVFEYEHAYGPIDARRLEEAMSAQFPADNQIASALRDVAKSIDGVASALRALGNADAATPMGAIEALGVTLKESLAEVAESVGQPDGSHCTALLPRSTVILNRGK